MTTQLPHAVANAGVIGGLGDVVFERPPIESFYEADYRSLRLQLEGQGWEITEVASFELRDATHELLQVVFRLMNDLGEDGVRFMISSIIEHLRKPKPPNAPARQAVIYGPDAQMLATVDLDEQTEKRL
jgi:hypothetical protein